MARLITIAMASIGIVAAPSLAQETPSVNDIFENKPGTTFRSWKLETSALSFDKQSYAIFRKGSRILIATTDPIVRGPRGGIEIEKIVRITSVTPQSGETEIEGFDCGFLGLSPAVAFLHKSTKVARGYFVTSERVEVRRWFVDEPELCAYSGD